MRGSTFPAAGEPMRPEHRRRHARAIVAAGIGLALLPVPADLSGAGARFELWSGHWGRITAGCLTSGPSSPSSCGSTAYLASATLYGLLPILLIALGAARQRRPLVVAGAGMAALLAPVLRLSWFSRGWGEGMRLWDKLEFSFGIESAAPAFSGYALVCSLAIPLLIAASAMTTLAASFRRARSGHATATSERTRSSQGAQGRRRRGRRSCDR